MAIKRKKSSSGTSVAVGVVAGVITGVTVMLAGALLLAYLIANETMGVEGIEIGSLIVVALSAAAGSWLAQMLVKQKKLIVCGITALAYYLILLSVTAVFFDGVFGAMGITALMILLGAGLTILPIGGRKAGKRKLKIPAYR